MERIYNYLNYFNGSHWKASMDIEPEDGGDPIHISLDNEKDKLRKLLNSIENLDSETFIQLGLYSLGQDVCPNKIDTSTTREVEMSQEIGSFIKHLALYYKDQNYNHISSYIRDNTEDVKIVKEIINSRSSELNSINKRIEHCSSKNGKMHFGKTYMFYILCFFLFISPVYSEVCCTLSQGSCPFSDNHVEFPIVLDNVNKICESYLIRYENDANGTHINYECTSIEIDPSTCIVNCNEGCSGNELFCSTRICNGNKCNCNKFLAKEMIICIDEFENDEKVGHRSIKHCYTKSMTEFKKRVLISCPPIDVIVDKDFIYTTIVSDFSNCVLYANKDSWNYQSAFQDSNMVAKIGDVAKIKTGNIDIKVVCGSNQCHHTSHYLDYTIQCTIVDCIFCWEVYSSLNCLPFSYKIFAFLVVLLTVSLIIAILPCFWVLIITVWKCIMIPKYCCWPMMKNYHKRLNQKLDEYKDTIDLEEATKNDNKRVKRGANFRGTSVNSSILLISCLFIINTCSAQCVSSPPISVSQPSCVASSASTETCTFTFSTTISIPFPGAKVCLTFNDNNNKLIGNLNITYINRTDIATLTTTYYTGLWEFLSSSFHGCYLNGWCDNGCASASDRGMYGFSTEIASYPGFTSCRRSCGCAACGCFFCDAGCVVSGYALRFISSAMAVADITRITFSYFLEYSYSSTKQIWSQNLGSVNIGPFKSDFIGSFLGDSTIFGTKNVIFNSTHQYFGEASEAGSPTQQQIGDIQAVSLTSLQSTSTSAFIHDPNIVSSTPQDKSTTFYYTNPGMNNLGLYPHFPITFSGSIWTYQNGQMRTSANNPGAVLLTITTSSPISLTRTKTIVCPEGEFISGSGCYNCDIGSVLKIKARSTCSSGLVRVETSTLSAITNLKSIMLLNSYSNFDIDITTSQAINQFDLLLIADQTTIRIPISFAAVENITLRNDTINQVPTGSTGASAIVFPSWDNFLDHLVNNSNGYQWLYVIYVVIAVILAIVILVFVLKLIFSMCSSGPKYKLI